MYEPLSGMDILLNGISLFFVFLNKYWSLLVLKPLFGAFFIMGRDPVELAKRAKYKPPAMRVRGVCYTKKSPFRYNEVVQAEIIAKGKVILMANKANSLAHTKWMCKYHIVFTPKYRRKIIYNQYKESIRDILKQLCAYKGVEILEGHLMPDHVHMLVSIPPKLSVSQFMGYLKGKSALMIFDKHANLKYKFGNRHFWAEGYYVSTVGLNEATIKKYIQEQESHDIAMDKLSVKEYEDPFKG
jgi:putative transposase